MGIPDTLATNSALGGTLKPFPEYSLFGFMHGRLSNSLQRAEVCCVRREKKVAAVELDGGIRVRLNFRFLQTENMFAVSCGCYMELCGH